MKLQTGARSGPCNSNYWKLGIWGWYHSGISIIGATLEHLIFIYSMTTFYDFPSLLVWCLFGLILILRRCVDVVYRKSLKETRGSYSFFEAWNAGLIQGRVSFEGGSYYWKNGKNISLRSSQREPISKAQMTLKWTRNQLFL